MNILMVCLWLFATMISFRLNPDLFSPSKFFFLVLGFDFFSIFLRNDYHIGVYLAYVGYIAVALMGSILEGHQKVLPRAAKKSTIKKSFSITALWLITLLPILAQVGLIVAMGGFEGYVNSISMRVSNWAGYGILVLLVKGIVPLHLLYFVLWRSTHGSVNLSGYLLHGAVYLFLALMSGSRGFLLGVIVSMLILTHYLRRPMTLRVVLSVAGMIFLVAGVIGVARTSIHLGDGGLTTGYSKISGRLLETSQLQVGCFVINHVLTESSGKIFLHRGETFLSIATALLPRSIFPDKLNTGGQVATNYILGDAYMGTSNYTPGILAESILNFGFDFGPFFAYVTLIMILLVTIWFYRRLRNKLKRNEMLCGMLVLYVSIAQIPANLLRGEWTNGLRGPMSWVFWISIVFILTSVLNVTSTVKSKHCEC